MRIGYCFRGQSIKKTGAFQQVTAIPADGVIGIAFFNMQPATEQFYFLIHYRVQLVMSLLRRTCEGALRILYDYGQTAGQQQKTPVANSSGRYYIL